MKITSIWKATLILTFLFFFAATQCLARDVTLEWDANVEPDLDGYIIYYDTDSGVPYNGNDANEGVSGAIMVDQNNTSLQLTGLAEGQTYYFTITAIDDEGLQSAMGREVCVLGTNDLDAGYDRGWAITSGDLTGFLLFYNDPVNMNNDKLSLGPSSDIPSISDALGVGLPLNLQPPTAPGDDFFNPVKIFIPCPGYSDVSGLDIYFWDGTDWSLANNDWMVPGSRVNHNNGNPSTIEIQVYHFSGAQAGVSSGSASSESGGGGGGCFIAASSF